MNSREDRRALNAADCTQGAEHLVEEQLSSLARRTDRMFAWLMGLQWIAAVALVASSTPQAGEGVQSTLNLHLESAVLLGGALACLPIYLAIFHPGSAVTRHVVAVAQVLWSALLVHLTGGRVDTHLQVFGSLAALACYRRWRVLVTATIVVALDRLSHGSGWPDASDGLLATGASRSLEYAGWVLFEVAFLGLSMRYSLIDLRQRAVSQELITERTGELERACEKLKAKNREQIAANHELVASETRRRRAHEETIHWLVKVSLYRDEETGAHIQRTGWYSELLAATAGWRRELVDQIRLAAPMHDLGKVGIPDAILLKPGKLTRDETAVMQTHTLLGAKMLDGSTTPVLRMAQEIALCHHERWDGKGYPAGLAGLEIPETARIVAIVDFYDALSHDRVYRPAFPETEVVRMLQEGRGTHFDPRLLDIFLSLLPEMRAIAQAVPDDAEQNEGLARRPLASASVAEVGQAGNLPHGRGNA